MATTDGVKTALAERETSDVQLASSNDLRAAVESMRPEFHKVLGSQDMVQRFVRVAMTELRQNPQLMRCSPESVLGALMTSAQLGLEPGRVTGEAWLVPYTNRRTGEVVCQFIVGYKGLIKLAWQSERVLSIVGQTVRDGDDFDFAYGLDPFLRHKPARTGRGDAYAWYAAAKIAGGGSAFEVLYRDDVERIRERSKAKDDGPWRTDYDAMAKKTAIRQLAKYLPMSTAFDTAAANDETVRTSTRVDQLDSPQRDDEEGAPL
jgi:recombination protein RecT